MDLKEKIAVLFWLLIGVSVSLSAVKLRLGRVNNPGPGFMSFYAGLFLIALSLILAALEMKKGRSKVPTTGALFSINRNLAISLLSLFCLATVFTTLGYLVSVALFVFVLLKMTAPREWIGPLLWSICFSLAAYLLFSVLLRSELPRGVFNIG